MSTADAVSATRVLARYAAQSRYEDLPGDVVHEAKRSFVNWLACALGGCRSDGVDRVLGVIRKQAGTPQAVVVGRAERLDVVHASLVNSMSAFVLDFDDAHSGDRIVLHPGGAVGPAALGVGERVSATGKELLHGFVLGVEVMCRVGNAVYESDNVGWFPTSNTAGMGAACAAAKLLHLTEAQTATAIGMAASMAAGTRASHGTMMKSFSPAHATSTGVAMALLAEAGLSGPQNAIEVPHAGFAHLMGRRDRLSSATDRLGEHFEMRCNAYKPFPCAIGLHPAITACLQLVGAGVKCDEISRIDVTAQPRVAQLNASTRPRNSLEAKISLPHSVAVAFVYGKAGERHYGPGVLDDALVARIRERVRIVGSDALGKDEGRVIVALEDGRLMDSGVVTAIGSPSRRLSDDDLTDKLRDLAAPLLSRNEASRLSDVCWSVDELTDLAPLLSLIAPNRRPTRAAVSRDRGSHTLSEPPSL